MKRILLLIAPVLLLASCASIGNVFKSIPQAAKDSHAQEGVNAKAISDSHLAVIEHVTDPEARATLKADAIAKWIAYSQSFDTTETALGGVPAVSTDTMGMILQFIKSQSKKPAVK